MNQKKKEIEAREAIMENNTNNNLNTNNNNNNNVVVLPAPPTIAATTAATTAAMTTAVTTAALASEQISDAHTIFINNAFDFSNNSQIPLDSEGKLWRDRFSRDEVCFRDAFLHILYWYILLYHLKDPSVVYGVHMYAYNLSMKDEEGKKLRTKTEYKDRLYSVLACMLCNSAQCMGQNSQELQSLNGLLASQDKTVIGKLTVFINSLK